MATTTPSLNLSTATTPFPAFPKPRSSPFLLPARSSSGTEPETDADADPGPAQTTADEDPFEARLSQVRLRYRSGKGKKAEVRKSRTSGGATAAAAASSSSTAAGGMYLPPVPLKEPKSEGLKVDFGFSPYSERVNGRIAMLGLTALLLVEIATGKGVINYHTPGTVLIQLYFVAAVAALYIKYEKERVSVWPKD